MALASILVAQLFKEVKRNTFFEVMLKSKNKLASWKARFLSRADKITLIKSNLASTPLRVMNCFKLTKRNNEDLDGINMNYVWLSNIGSNETNVFPLVSHENVCRPKSEGGLGIRKNDDVNKTSIAKLGWRILTDNDSRIWVRIMRDKYLKNDNFFRIPKNAGDSIVWKEIINHEKLIGTSLKLCIGDGKKS